MARDQRAFEGVTPERAQLTNLGTVVFEVPRMEKAVRARLEMRLLNASGELVTRNHHELYFFPRSNGRPATRLSARFPATLGPPQRHGLRDDRRLSADLVWSRP